MMNQSMLVFTYNCCLQNILTKPDFNDINTNSAFDLFSNEKNSFLKNYNCKSEVLNINPISIRILSVIIKR